VTWVGWLGVVLIAVSAVGDFGVGLAAVLPAGLRLRRVAVVTAGLVDGYRDAVDHSVWLEREHALERAVLLRPYRRVERVVTHPLVIALGESYLRRRARARAGEGGGQP